MNLDTILKQIENEIGHGFFEIGEVTNDYVTGYDMKKEWEFKVRLTPAKRVKKWSLTYPKYALRNA